MEVLSYIIVILFSRISLGISTFFSIPLSIIFAWLSKRKLAVTVSFFSGVSGPFISIFFSKYIFYEIGGFANYTLEMYLAAMLPMMIPIYSDYKKYRELKNKEEGMELNVHSDIPYEASTMASFPLGAIFGIALTLLLF